MADGRLSYSLTVTRLLLSAASLLAELLWLGDHRSEHLANPRAFSEQDVAFCFGDVIAGHCSVQPMLCFSLFAIRICQLAYEMGGITSLLPGFREISAYGP